MKKFTITLTTIISFVFALNAQSASTFINEINYLASNPTQGIEIVGQAGQDLAGWSIVMHAVDGAVEYVEYLSGGLIPSQQNGYGSIWYDVEQGTNGGGIALVNPNGAVVQFLSYGTTGFANIIIQAVEGPAQGMVSDFVGVQLLPENSLQLTGTGLSYLDFVWSIPLGGTPGTINTNQTFGLTNQLGLFESTSSVEFEEELDLTVFPNPTTDFVQVKLPRTSVNKGMLELFDANGKRLNAINFNTEEINTLEINLSQYDLGTYILRVTNGETQVAKSIIRT